MNLARFFGDPGPFWEPFWASGIQRGSQNPAFGDQFSIRGVKNGVPEGGREKVRKIEEINSHTECFGGRLQPRKSCSRVGAVHILLKQVVAEMVKKIIQNCVQNGSQSTAKMGPWGIPGRSVGGIVLFRMVLGGACFSPRHFGVSGASGRSGDYRGSSLVKAQVLSICVFIYD